MLYMNTNEPLMKTVLIFFSWERTMFLGNTVLLVQDMYYSYVAFWYDKFFY